MGISIRNKKAIIDPKSVETALEAVAQNYRPDQLELRNEVMQVLKKALTEGRAEVRNRLEERKINGLQCGASLCYLMDELITLLADFTLKYVFRVTNPTSSEVLALVATGGYGRGLLAPSSDIDLLFLLPYKQTAWSESVVEWMLYVLWDLGLKVGHATRNINECARLAKSDATILTSMLEARQIWGDGQLFSQFKETFWKECVNTTGIKDFVDAKLTERDNRHERLGNSRYLVEPNIKEGKGGLRDLQTLYWIAKYIYQVEDVEELVNVGLITDEEHKKFDKAELLLWTARCHLHFLTGRGEERLTFDVQVEMARRLGYQDHAGTRGVERFMKHYFWVAKDVGDLTRIFCAALEEQSIKSPLSTVKSLLPRLRRSTMKDAPGFRIDGNRLTVDKNTVFETDPVNLIKLFYLAQKHDLDIHPDALRLVTRSLHLIRKEVRQSQEANQLFMEILLSKRDPATHIRRMNEAGVLGKFVPDFGKIVALMQFNMYHHYTADEHLIRAIDWLFKIEQGALSDEHPLANEIIHKITNRPVLYVAMFLHDIAKGRPGDHSILGAEVARKLCPRLGMSKSETETVAWLVQEHLTMSDTAQTRDVTDPKTVQDFAAIVQSPERLKLLLVLTVADIRAVGPGTWNGWKGQLLRQLYHETEAVLSGGFAAKGRQHRVDQAKEDFALEMEDWKKKDISDYCQRHYDAYWLTYAAETHKFHANLIRESEEKNKKLAITTRIHPFTSVTEVTVYTLDHPGLFAQVAGAFAVCGVNIMDAKAHTTIDGMALDSFTIQDEEGQPIEDKARIDRIKRTLSDAITVKVKVQEKIDTKSRRAKRTAAFSVAPQVFVDNNASDIFTVVEINGLDRPGLLYDVTRALFGLSLTIASSHVVTFGERAVDVFYVKDAFGMKVTNGNKIKAIERHLLKALTGDDNSRKGRKKSAAA